MKASQFLVSTLKEAPQDAEIVSHQLMIRSGMIKKLGAGIYSYMPMGLRVIRKVEAIIRQEMERAGAIELTMPLVQPAELWQETGRFEKMGPELLRIRDRHERDFVIQPTSEEVVTDIARQEIKSYKQLPKNFYQIQTKFRDERRPRFGLMRGREFIMKDAYSFDVSPDKAKESYAVMAKAYRRIFDRFGLQYRAVAADSGAIGGDLSEEFQVIAATGEDAIVFCPQSDYAANMEKAQALPPTHVRQEATQALKREATPTQTTCEDVAALLNIPLQKMVKSLVWVYEPEGEGATVAAQYWLVLIRGDHELNEVKLGKVPSLSQGHLRLAHAKEIEELFTCVPGFLGPVGRPQGVRLLVDREVALMSDWVCGANAPGFHLSGVNWGRDLELPSEELIHDLRNVVSGDLSPCGKGQLSIERGIEVGHIFYLGTKYSKAMNATFLDVNGKPQAMEMGCYGIGVTRLPAAAIEQNHDSKGMIWPESIAPFVLVICPIGMDRSDEVRLQANALYDQALQQGWDVILDDRGERPGVMFADWELIGVPHRLVVSERSIKSGVAEYQHRRDSQATELGLDQVMAFLKDKIQVSMH
jgi:prolyl-tRNA synthetase